MAFLFYAPVWTFQMAYAGRTSTFHTTIYCNSLQQLSLGVHEEPWDPGYYLNSQIFFHNIHLDTVFKDWKCCKSVYFPYFCSLKHQHIHTQKHHYADSNCGKRSLEKYVARYTPTLSNANSSGDNWMIVKTLLPAEVYHVSLSACNSEAGFLSQLARNLW